MEERDIEVHAISIEWNRLCPSPNVTLQMPPPDSVAQPPSAVSCHPERSEGSLSLCNIVEFTHSCHPERRTPVRSRGTMPWTLTLHSVGVRPLFRLWPLRHRLLVR